MAISRLASVLLFFIPLLFRPVEATGQASAPSWVTGVQGVAYTTGLGTFLWIVPATGLVALAVSLLYGPVFYVLGKKARRTWVSRSIAGILCIAGGVSELLFFWLFAQVMSASSASSAFTTSPGVQASADNPLNNFTIYFWLSLVASFLVGVWGQTQLRTTAAYPAAVSEAEAARIRAVATRPEV